eukprot:5668039-Alexandrium_andersonii.AAC.1
MPQETAPPQRCTRTTGGPKQTGARAGIEEEGGGELSALRRWPVGSRSGGCRPVRAPSRPRRPVGARAQEALGRPYVTAPASPHSAE